jgi:hypothetical protein
MTEGRDGIGLAPKRAPGLMGVAGRLSVVAAMLAMAALVAGTAGSGNAGSGLLDPVTVTNSGGVFNGSLQTFAAGSKHNAKPAFRVRGVNSLLSIGPYGEAVSSVDGHIAVALPFDFTGQSATNASVQAPINALFALLSLPAPPIGCGTFGFPTTAPLFGTGLVGIFSPTSSGDSAPEKIICSPGFSIGEDGADLVPGQFPNTTGVFVPRGVAFESPFDGNPNVPPGHEILAVTNVFPEVIQDAAPCIAGGVSATGVTLGTITLYDRATLTATGLNDVPPVVNNVVTAINPLPATGFPKVDPPLGPIYEANASIAGCLTSLAGPRNLSFDQFGFLFVVNNAPPLTVPPAANALSILPHFLSVFDRNAALETTPPFSQGDVFPLALIGIAGTGTERTLGQPVDVAVATLGFENDLAFVTDTGESAHGVDLNCTAAGKPYACCTGGPASVPPQTLGTGTCPAIPAGVKIFDVFTNPDLAVGFAFSGQLLATIQGPATKLKTPEGIALSADGDTLYVANLATETLSMFTDVTQIETQTGSLNIAPTVTISGSTASMALPNGARVFPQFSGPPI